MFEGTRVREHVFELRSALKGAARTSPAKAGREAKYTEFCKGEGSGSRVAPSRSDAQNMCLGWCSVVIGTVFEKVSCFGRTAVLVDM